MSTRFADRIAGVLFPKSRRAVLELLFSHPGESFYLRQIVSLTGLGVGQIQRELQVLKDAGIISREAVGRHVYFRSDSECPVYVELRGIVAKTMGAAARIGSALEEIAAIEVAFLFGSVASGAEKAASDIDVMIVGDISAREVVRALKPVEDEVRREINAVVYPPQELREKLDAGHHFLVEVVGSARRFVKGGEDELAAILGQ